MIARDLLLAALLSMTLSPAWGQPMAPRTGVLNVGGASQEVQVSAARGSFGEWIADVERPAAKGKPGNLMLQISGSDAPGIEFQRWHREDAVIPALTLSVADGGRTRTIQLRNVKVISYTVKPAQAGGRPSVAHVAISLGNGTTVR